MRRGPEPAAIVPAGAHPIARLFVAIALPGDVRAEADRAIESLRPHIPHARWIAPENLHVTVAFVGETADGDRVVRAAAAAAGTSAPLALRLEGLGAFPSARRARVVWAGLSGEVPALASVAEALWDRLAGQGFTREVRPFAAHVTLARLREPAPVAVGDAVAGPAAFTATGLGVYRSHLGRPAARYERLAFAPFTG